MQNETINQSIDQSIIDQIINNEAAMNNTNTQPTETETKTEEAIMRDSLNTLSTEMLDKDIDSLNYDELQRLIEALEESIEADDKKVESLTAQHLEKTELAETDASDYIAEHLRFDSLGADLRRRITRVAIEDDRQRIEFGEFVITLEDIYDEGEHDDDIEAGAYDLLCEDPMAFREVREIDRIFTEIDEAADEADTIDEAITELKETIVKHRSMVLALAEMSIAKQIVNIYTLTFTAKHAGSDREASITLSDSDFNEVMHTASRIGDTMVNEAAGMFVLNASQRIYTGSDTRCGCIQETIGDWLLVCSLICRERINQPVAQ